MIQLCSMNNQVLFICTGNYYRSRFSEIYFNHLLGTDASFSRGFEVFKARNEGPISRHTSLYLDQLGIAYDSGSFPKQLTADDLEKSGLIILLDKKEHLPMYSKYFPERKDDIVYWEFEDIQFQSPEDILPMIKNAVEELAANYTIH